MNTESYKILMLVLVGAAVCAGLHWLIGLGQRWIARRYTSERLNADGSPTSLTRLSFDWVANALRIVVWFLFFAFLINVLPQTRTRVEGVGEKLGRLHETLLSWLVHRGIYVLLVIGVTIFLMRFASALIKTIFHLIERSGVEGDEGTAHRRLKTLSAIFRGAAQSIISFIGLMFLLQQLNVNVTPILASAGVVGLAVGFGAQSLIKDLFSGLLILLEDQYNVGDSVKIAETSGKVEQLTLRITRIRSVDGSLTTIPNGSIVKVTNMSKDWARVLLDIEIDFDEDVEKAMRVISEAAHELMEERPQDLLKEPTVLGLERMTAAGVTLRMTAKTVPAKQFEIARELRRLIKLAFEREGIKIKA